MALECRKLRLKGIDPIEARKKNRDALKTQQALEAAKAKTFKECATEFIDAHEAEWKNPKHRHQWTATLETYAYPILGNLPVQAVNTSPPIN